MKSNEKQISKTESSLIETDMVIVGAGFAGLYALYKYRGMGKHVVVLEKGDGVGGTWYWNCYPGARCDVESMEYSYQFDDALQQEWKWTERYASQEEILEYLNHVADRYGLRKDIRLGTAVHGARYDSKSNRWYVETSAGDTYSTEYLVMATGALSRPNWPKFVGIKDFQGPIYHTGEWPNSGVDFTDKRVAVIGTGSSGIQVIPEIAKVARSLTVFQRTPNFCVPARNRPLTEAEQKEVKRHYKELRELAKQLPFGAQLHHSEMLALECAEEERREVYEERWGKKYGGLQFLGAFQDLLLSTEAGETAADFIREKIHHIVKDPKTAELLCPKNIAPGCKRLCSGTDFFETFNLPHVELVDVSGRPIERFTEKGIQQDGKHWTFDMIVLATGFDALTGAVLQIEIQGRDGVSLKDKWREGPRTYLGISTEGFPNLFFINGPGSPSVLSNMVPSIEHHVDLVADLIDYKEERRAATVEAGAAEEEQWMKHVFEVADQTIYTTCASWYVGSNIPGKPEVFMPYVNVGAYRQECEKVIKADYQGFRFS